MSRTLPRSTAFARDLRAWLKANPKAADDIQPVLEQPSADAFHPSLRSHKLKGTLAGCRACSAGYDLRVVYEFVQHDGAEGILLLALGTHDQVY